jgi:hypothetical protein
VLQRQIVAKEREGLDALKAGNVERFGELIADDAVLIDAHGSASKAQVLQNVAGFKLTEYTMDDIKLVPLSAKSGLIAYTISEKGISHGKNSRPEPTFLPCGSSGEARGSESLVRKPGPDKKRR